MERALPSPRDLGRSERLRRAADIQAVFQRGHREERRSFVALWRLSGGGRRAGFAVSRRVGGAVERNRVRRRIREAYRLQQHALRSGIDVVFIGRPVALTEPFVDLYEEMRQALRALTRIAGDERSGVARE